MGCSQSVGEEDHTCQRYKGRGIDQRDEEGGKRKIRTRGLQSRCDVNKSMESNFASKTSHQNGHW